MRNPSGHEYEYRSLNPFDLVSDPLYQRPINMKRVEKIVREFNGDVFNEPKVSFRDGKYYVFNGDHSVAAWKKIFPDGKTLLNCKVFYGMTWQDECDAFIIQNGISKDPTTNEKLRAAYNVGKPDVVDMVHRAEMSGYIVDFGNAKTADRIVATSSLYKAYKLLGPDQYTEMLRTIKSAWNGETDAISNHIILGLSKVYKVYDGEFTNDSMTNCLRKVAPIVIIRDGKNIGGSNRNAYALAIVKQYNKKRTKNRLDETRLGTAG